MSVGDLRADLQESNRRVISLEAKVAAQARRHDELTFSLREAEEERERLRTLLAGTAWFDDARRWSSTEGGGGGPAAGIQAP